MSLVVGLGVDLVEISRVRRVLERWGERLVEKLMSPPEASVFAAAPDPGLHLAGAIALKEAASKALGTGWSRGVRWRDVVAAPQRAAVRLEGPALARAAQLGSSGRCQGRLERRGDLLVAEVRLLS